MDIKNKSRFIEHFSKGIKSLNQLKIGVEHERFLFEGQNKKRISYQTLRKLFKNLESNGWQPLFEKKNIKFLVVFSRLHLLCSITMDSVHSL